jgi:dipeptidyl aminopeptidase/acylaminoacyl peptidase
MNNAILVGLGAIVLAGGLYFFGGKQPDKAKETPSAPKTAKYGEWVSPIGALDVTQSGRRLSYITATDTGFYFIERVGAEGGANVLFFRDTAGEINRVSPKGFNVRTRVHEYGGKPYVVVGNAVYFSNFADQFLYRMDKDSEPNSYQKPRALTPTGLRYMECIDDTNRDRLICVREDHRGEGEAVNKLVAIDKTQGGEGDILFEGTDFVRSATLSANGENLAFIHWIHPNMPWDDTQISHATFNDNGSLDIKATYGEEKGGALGNPKFSPEGELHFTSDWDNWWNIYRATEELETKQITSLTAEVNSYQFEDDGTITLTYKKDGLQHLASLDKDGGIKDIIDPTSSIGIAGNYVSMATPTKGTNLYSLADGNLTLTMKLFNEAFSNDIISEPRQVSFSVANGVIVPAFFYPPKNPDFTAPEGTKPPLIVFMHGGPVGSTSSTLDMRKQFWTSRGFAILDINYRGSTGFGREYRHSLYPNWGVTDVEDAAMGAKWAGTEGLVDSEQLAIRGGSAGGYTVLAAMAFHDAFKAGASYFGISDLEALTKETHKFESRYLDQLVGPYPETIEAYKARSPINHADKISAPLLLLQGLDDRVVPPNQSEMIYKALRENCIPTAYMPFEGEGHGFRKPENNIKSMNAELDFYGQVFGFNPPNVGEGVTLEVCE